MPQPLDVDREAVKAHAIQHGVREAARTFGLKETTVMQWSARGGWLKDAGKAVVAQPLPASIRPVSTVSKSPSEAAKHQMQKLNDGSKLKAAQAIHAGLSHAAKQKGEVALAQMPLVKAGVDAASKLYGWGGDQGQSAFLGLHVTVQTHRDQVLDVPVEVTQVPDNQDQSSQ